MCKWNAFTIDSTRGLCKYEASPRENIFHLPGSRLRNMNSAAATPLGDDTTLASHNLPLGRVRALLETVDKGMLVADREGLVLATNTRARKFLEEQGKSE